MLLQEVQKRTIAMERVSPKLDSRMGDAYPTKGGDGGDDCLWLGLLASTGHTNSLEGIRACQSFNLHNGKYGMFYRNPVRKVTDNQGYEDNYFSRDMALGVLCAYAVETDSSKLSTSSHYWIQYIQNNRPCRVRKPRWMGGGCLIRHPFYTLAPGDDRVNITPSLWALMGRVWDYRCLSQCNQMRDNKGMDGDSSVISARTVPLGYQLHLNAVGAYIKFLCKQSREYRQKVSSICYERLPANLFYKVLSQEMVYDIDLEEFLDICPNPDTFESKPYWIWEKGDFEQGLKEGKMCGWDMVFMGKLLISLYG